MSVDSTLLDRPSPWMRPHSDSAGGEAAPSKEEVAGFMPSIPCSPPAPSPRAVFTVVRFFSLLGSQIVKPSPFKQKVPASFSW